MGRVTQQEACPCSFRVPLPSHVSLYRHVSGKEWASSKYKPVLVTPALWAPLTAGCTWEVSALSLLPSAIV